MKNIAIKVFITLVIFLNVTIVVGQTSGAVLKQDSRDTLNLNGNKNRDKVLLSLGVIIAHFNTANNRCTRNIIYSTPFNLGAEALVNYKLYNNWLLLTGVNYQFGRLGYDGVPSERLTFGELTVPVLTSIYFFRNRINLTSGVYFGKYIHLIYETRAGKMSKYPERWGNVTKYSEGYSEDRYISDFYFSVGYNTIKKSRGFFQFNLFARYRLNEIWVNNYVSKFVFGAKINYLINLKL